uniref:Cytochrome P450 n=1 Tax=Arcella intermedia TaxID=1963864 RepID=A0A6B2LL09_9EUKA
MDMKCGEQSIPAGTRVGVDVRSIHYSPKYWEDPEVFDPERFNPERRKGHHKFSFLPFSLGQRKCIGAEFSEIEQRLFLARFLREFKVLPAVDHDKVDLRLVGELGKYVPIYVRIEKRDK